MVAPTEYRSDDPGSPVVAGNTVDAVIGLLTACLVTGYGAKSPAGWTKPYTGTNKAVFQQGGGNNRCLQVTGDDGTLNYARLRMYETMSDVDTGVGPTPTDAQESGGMYAFKSGAADATARPWIVFATARSVLVIIFPLETDLTFLSTAYRSTFGMVDGESYVSGDLFETVIIGGYTTSYFSGAAELTFDADTTFTPNPGFYILRDHASTPGSEAISLVPAQMCALGESGSNVETYPDPIQGKYLLTEVLIREIASSYSMRGKLPGIWGTPHDDIDTDAFDTFTGNGVLAGKNFLIVPSVQHTTLVIETNGGWL